MIVAAITIVATVSVVTVEIIVIDHFTATS